MDAVHKQNSQVCHLRLGPHIYTKDEAIARLRRRAALDGSQQEMSWEV
jgi:hypothetical protein